MKSYFIKNLILLFLICGIISELASCSLINSESAAVPTYWEKSSGGTIKTDDLDRLQKEVPFTMILPEYLPDGKQSYKVDAAFRYLEQHPGLSIYYYHKTHAKEILIVEGPPWDSIPRPLPPGLFAKMNPDLTPIELSGIEVEVLEEIGIEDIIFNNKITRVSSYHYLWEKDNVTYSISIWGYDQEEARKIVESMLK